MDKYVPLCGGNVYSYLLQTHAIERLKSLINNTCLALTNFSLIFLFSSYSRILHCYFEEKIPFIGITVLI